MNLIILIYSYIKNLRLQNKAEFQNKTKNDSNSANTPDVLSLKPPINYHHFA